MVSRDERTPAQVAADDALTRAIDEVCRAYSPTQFEDPSVTAEYIVVAAHVNYPNEGHESVGVSMIMRDSWVPP